MSPKQFLKHTYLFGKGISQKHVLLDNPKI